ncbi:MAG: ATP-binding protein [Cyclobacteriaceae bacterium]|nr:ATP-binding protein [Cyclobacteriaceae bacterium]
MKKRLTHSPAQFAIAILLVVGVSLVSFLFNDFLGHRVVALLLLLVVSVNAMLFHIVPVLVSACISALIWNYFFIPPIFTFHINSIEDVLMFSSYFVVALINGALTYKIRDIEQKAREKEEKEKEVKLYNTLLNSLSHELRTPIATIIGSTDVLLDDTTTLAEPQKKELTQEIHLAGLRLNRQVENLLNMSRLESGMLKPKLVWTDLHELVASVAHKIVPEQTHRISITTANNLPLFKIDSGLTEQIVYNLLYNAVQYTAPGTNLFITIQHAEDNMKMEIADTGKGFPENEIPFIFDKFYRLPNTKAGGSGLGLSIVKGFTEAQNGTVTLQNRKEGGACFTITIPAETNYMNNLKHD